MNLSRSFAPLALASLTFLIACATGNEDLFSNIGGEGGQGDGGDGGFGVPGQGGSGGLGGAGGATSTGTGQTCAPSCTQDSDCANTCAAVPNTQSNCCDTVSGTCYVYDASLCPVPDPGTGGTPTPY
ncbi:hypothetical protein [Chondromyces crocatus]|uniref:Secreted protein n=1 Tax=Chondromyces crocatus TaxID=52 RepID=A0A0K1EDY6_CHOCO|nr:hypothetical protein [Chondromyces crocatus]AKT38912.1 uncharacterized protein CMC5_030590 [Chondromyces crocatus]